MQNELNPTQRGNEVKKKFKRFTETNVSVQS